jgi:hypothetical protein
VPVDGSAPDPARGDDRSALEGIPAPPGRGALAASWLGWWAIGMMLWMILDDTTVLPELIDGAVAAAIGATGATVAYARRSVPLRLPHGWARWWWRPLTQFVADLGALTRVLARALNGGEREAGAVREQPFALSDDPATRHAQIALAAVAGSFAANTVVLGVDEERSVIIVHELAASRGGDRRCADPLELG